MEEQFIQLVEDKSAYGSQGKRKNLVERNMLLYGRHTMYFHMVVFCKGTIICFASIKSKLSH